MKIEIFSDASVNLQSGDAGFAYWIACQQFECQYASHIANKTICNAELFAINHALEYLMSRELISVTSVDIYTDSLEAMHKIKGRKSSAFFSMIELTLKNGMRARQVENLFHVYHVKAHTKNNDVASHKNRFCDMMAKQHRVMKTEFKATIFDESEWLLYVYGKN